MNNLRVQELLAKYNFDFDTTRGGCLSFLEYESRNIAHIYLRLLDTLDHVDRKVNLKRKKKCFEIGGGFGVNVHLLVEFFNIKKIIYLDIVPNLYVGTQYLKSFYGEKVVDFSKSKDKKSIDFEVNNDLEIFCIAPHQIDNVVSEIDFFHNAHSFVEMPKNIVSNYAKKVEAKMAKTNSAISMVSYDGFDLATTFDPEKLPTFFTKPAEEFSVPTLSPQRSNFHFVIQ
jgi:putative sugar O-methyltransferase